MPLEDVVAAIGLNPYLIFPDVTLHEAAAPQATLRFILYAVPAGMILLLPSLWFLFWVFKRERKPTGAGSP